MDAGDPGPELPQLAGETAVRQGAGQGQADHCKHHQQTGGPLEGEEGAGLQLDDVTSCTKMSSK